MIVTNLTKIIIAVLVVILVIAAVVVGLTYLLTARPDFERTETEEALDFTASEYDSRTDNESHGFADSSEDPDLSQYPLDYEESQYSREFELAGINLADSYETVQQTYGQPLSRKVTSEKSIHNPDYICYWTSWYYDDLEVLFMKVEENGQQLGKDIGNVFAIKVVSEDYATHRGIRVGDTVSQALESYNQEYEGAYFSQDNDELFFEDGLNCIRFSVKEERISEILASQILN
ncbi:MAG TPA: hypothetical protein DHD79_00490 [Firmicutes bacterium]|nr:hypothetical protein [Bacillota bacterium]HAZ22688.1 hypothetical protein [Bacillota bacterium]HBE05572.1 hypothetical protein [Bacillota bacterium]HBL48925.1 hypothetical protein [Bacillota bacterium]HBL69361.1 hypothetical protein [Bacillota bacterium]